MKNEYLAVANQSKINPSNLEAKTDQLMNIRTIQIHESRQFWGQILQTCSDLGAINLTKSTSTNDSMVKRRIEEKKASIQTFSTEVGSGLGIVEDEESVFEHLVRASSLELANKAKVLPRTTTAIVDLALDPIQLRFLRRSHHRDRSTSIQLRSLSLSLFPFDNAGRRFLN